jgi:uncharacterized membrane protein YeiB
VTHSATVGGQEAAIQTAGTEAPVETRRPTSRITGIDLARAAAILGMLAVHVGPTEGEGFAGALYAAPHGRASILFGLLAGVGVSLLAGSSRTTPAKARVTLAWRAALLLPIGLALQLLDHGALVILQDYALLFVLGLVMIAVPDRWLLALAGAFAVFGSLGFLWGTIAAPAVFDRGPIAITDPVGSIVHGLVLSGPYPLITWAAPFLLGMWLGRRDLRAPAVRMALLAGGGAAAVLAVVTSAGLVAVFGEPTETAGWDHLLLQAPHSQMPLWLIGATGSAVFVLGGALIVADRAPRLVRPLVATGQLALTVYVGHLVALHLAPDALTAEEVLSAVGLVAAFTLTAAVFASSWLAAFRRGPLEMLLRPPWPQPTSDDER